MRRRSITCPAPVRKASLPRWSTLAAAGAALGFLAFAPGCGPATPPTNRDDAVLLISIDTVPADRVGCYGDPRVRTPVLDRLARRGLQVFDAIAPAPLTLPSHTTMLTGMDPPEHGVRENGLFIVPDSIRTLPERLPKETPKAAFIGAFPLAARFGLAQGFDIYDADFSKSTDRRHPPERRASVVLAAAAAWVEALPAARRPFVWTHLYDAHYPYSAPRPWPRIAATLATPGAYEGEVAYVDHEIGVYLHRLESAGRHPKVLLAADHGESLDRHGEITHGLFVYDATQRIPLIWSGPGIARRLDPDQRRLRDVTRTLLAALGGDAADLAGARLEDPPVEEDAYVETKHTELLRGWAPLYGMRTAEWKYIRAPRPELYDLRRDPGESTNVLPEHPDVVRRLSSRVDDILAVEAGRPPMRLDERTAEQLRSLGYVAAIADPSEADVRKDPKDGAAGAAALFWGEDAYGQGDLDAAERWLLQAIRLDPSAKDAHSFLSGVYMSQGRAREATEEAHEALRLPPHLNESPVHATLGEALLALGEPAEAIPHLRIAQQSARSSPRVSRLLAEAEAKVR